MPEKASDIIRTRRSAKLAEKEPIYKLLDDSYRGGFAYKQGKHLKKYPREWSEVFKTREERAVYFNYLQPIVDILSGFIFKNEPDRKLPSELEALKGKAFKRRGIEQGMQGIGINTLMYTMGVLVDSPKYDTNAIKSEADRKRAGLNPYACLYYPHQIRDFAINEDGKLIWVLLDDSRIEKSDPLQKEQVKKVYRLWTDKFYQDFEIKENAQTKETEVIAGEEAPHPVGYVPFHFVNWRDVDDDHISDSPMEDVAILSEQIYNTLSLLDEQLHTGTFASLAMPVRKKEDVPDDVVKTGIYDVPVLIYDGTLSQSPAYIRPGLDTIDPFITAVKLYIYEIFRKIGMDVDRDKSYTQSGAAMGKEFQKTEALLRFGAESLQQCEDFIFRTMGRWLGKDYGDEIKISYSKTFQVDDLDLKLKRLYDVFNLGLQELQQLALEQIIRLVLPKADASRLSKETSGNVPDFTLNSSAAAQTLATMKEQLANTQKEANNV